MERYRMRRGRFGVVACLALFLCFGCSAGYQSVKRGDELVQARSFYGAVQEYMTALRLEPDNKEAKTKLCQFAKPAYDEKLQLAESSEMNSSFDSAHSHYSALAGYLDSLNSYNCLNFTPVQAKEKAAQMRTGASEKFYREAEKSFTEGQFAQAIPKYAEALQRNNPYKDSVQKTAECHYQVGVQSEKAKKFRGAAKSFESASATVTGYKDSVDRCSALYCGLGDYFLSKKLCRNAYNDFTEAARINPNTQGIAEKLKNAEECAVSRIALVKLDNPTHKDISGMSLGEFIFDEIASRLHKQASKFVHVVERNEMDEVLGELRLGTSGITDEFTQFQRVKGVHHLVFGKLTQVRRQHLTSV